MTVQEVWEWIDAFVPFDTQEEYDNAGLLVGDPSAEANRLLFALDATLPVVREAQAAGAQLIVTHHPLMFEAIRRIRTDQPEGAVLAALAGAGISLIAAHTNLDRAPGGTGDSLALALGLSGVRPVAGSDYLRSGLLPEPRTASSFLRTLDRRLGACARLYGDPEAVISRVTVGAGAGGSDYPAAAADGAEVFVTGEMKHHELLGARALGLQVVEAGHYYSEQPGLVALYQRFRSDAEAGEWPVQTRLTAIPPFSCTVA